VVQVDAGGGVVQLEGSAARRGPAPQAPRPEPDWLLDLTRQLVTEGLCASAHNFAPVPSIYRWKGEVHEPTEGRASLHTKDVSR
jgi:hypothetical protein